VFRAVVNAAEATDDHLLHEISNAASAKRDAVLKAIDKRKR